MTGAVMGVMSFGVSKKGYQAACKEHRQFLETEKTKKQIPSAEPEGTDLPTDTLAQLTKTDLILLAPRKVKDRCVLF